MASLHIIKGLNQGQDVTLTQDRTTLGRNPECTVVIPVTSVSREHAHILRVQNRFFIEDLQSRNGTFVNNVQINARTPLKNNDRIRICDFQAAFQDSPFPPLPEELRKQTEAEEEDEGDGSTTVEATVSHSSHVLLETQPAEKLKALLEISANLCKTLELDPLLPKIGDSLFQLFRQADRCFLILAEEGSTRLLPKLVKTRRAQDEANARFSKSIVRQCLETGQAFLSDDASADKRIPLSQSVLDFRIRSVMCAPLVGGGEGKAFGVIQLDTQDRSKKFTQEDLKLLVGVANQASVALENARFHEDSVARERLRRDLELAHQVQLSFLPRQLPAVPGYEFFATYEPAQEVGGDYYGFIPLAGQKLAIAVGDVAGKGVPAALLMVKLSSDTRFCFLTEEDPAVAVSRLNDMLCEHTSQMDRFVTLAGAVLDPVSHTATLVSAGHPPPLLVRGGGTPAADAMPKEIPGMPLGVMEGQRYGSCQLVLQPGDCLLFFSDGVPDAINVRNTPFGMNGMQAVLQTAGALSAKTLGERIIKAVKAHAAGRAQHDDITLVCISRTS